CHLRLATVLVLLRPAAQQKRRYAAQHRREANQCQNARSPAPFLLVRGVGNASKRAESQQSAQIKEWDDSDNQQHSEGYLPPSQFVQAAHVLAVGVAFPYLLLATCYLLFLRKHAPQQVGGAAERHNQQNDTQQEEH